MPLGLKCSLMGTPINSNSEATDDTDTMSCKNGGKLLGGLAPFY
jgi:hypothetical protein